MKKRTIFTLALMVLMSVACLAGCGQEEAAQKKELKEITVESTAKQDEGGVLFLKVNPEISVYYDADGNVYKVEARNDDGKTILKDYTGYEGKKTRQVVTELVTAIGEAGYFVEELEGEKRKVTIEIESGSVLPSETFLDEVIADVQECVNSHDWSKPMSATNRLDYDVEHYHITDYGTVQDTPTTAPEAKPVPTPKTTDYGMTDYDDTDYGPNNDGVTDYDDTDYGPNNDGVTDYGHTDYDDPATDYGTTDYDD